MNNDPLKAAPDIYKVLLENERVRVLHGSFEPGSSAPMHYHPDHLVFVLSGGTIKLTSPDGTEQEVLLENRQLIWNSQGSHSAENTGNTEINLLAIELTERLSSSQAA